MTNCRRSLMVAAIAMLTLAVAAPTWATILVNEQFTYANGALVGKDPPIGAAWAHHSGAVTGEMQVVNGAAYVVQTSQTEDVNVPFEGGEVAGAGERFYAGFDLQVTAGTVSTVYFAHFLVNSSTFTTRIFLTTFGGSDYTLGLSDTGTINVTWASGLLFTTKYRVVVSYDFDSRISKLWINPTVEGSTSITAAAGGASQPITAFALREANPGNTIQVVDNLIVGTTFAEALGTPVLTGACCVGGNCSVIDQSYCQTILSGSYQGNNTNCDANPCGAATGACCNGINCTTTTQLNCQNVVGGTYLGDATTCSPNFCAGACCISGNCTITTSGNCGGEYIGNGTTCASAPCAPGACCHNNNCTQETATACETLGGIFRGVGVACDGSACPASLIGVVINELDSDQASNDTAEFVELKGPGTTSLTGLVLVFYNGSNNLSYAAFDLTGSTNAGGYYVVGNAGVVPAPNQTFADNTLQNGPDAVALFLDSAANFPNNTPVTRKNLVDAVVYGNSNPDATGLLPLLNAFQPQVDEDNPNGGGLTRSAQRCPDASGGRRNTTTYAAAVPSPGAANGCNQPTGACCNGVSCTIETQDNCINGVGGRYQGDNSTCNDGSGNNVCGCRTINAAHLAPSGAGFRLCDVIVTNTISTVASPNKGVQVQDVSGASPHLPRGITLFGTEAVVNAALAGAVPGDRISLTGTTSDFSGLRELVAGGPGLGQPLQNVAGPVPVGLPAPEIITAADMLDGSATAENLESVRVKLECVQFTSSGTFAVANYTVTDGTNTASVRVPTNAINLIGDTIPSGNVGLIGILTQFDSTAPFDAGYQLLLVNETDIVPASNCVGASGACCLPIGTCSQTTQTLCEGSNGAFQGANSTCPDPDCVATTAACCIGGACVEMTPANCQSQGGIPSPLGTPCSAANCCGNITQARTASSDGTVLIPFELCEVVVTDITDLVNSGNSKSFTAQDGSCPNASIGSRGVNFFGPNADIDAITTAAPPGTRIRIRGNATQFNGLFQMGGPFTVNVLGTVTPPAPAIISAADLLDASPTAECYESRLVTINCLTFVETGTFALVPTDYHATDASNNTIVVRLQTAALDWANTPIPTGPVTITGVVSQFDASAPVENNYELLPRALADFTVCNPEPVIVVCTGGDLNYDGQTNGLDVDKLVDTMLGGPFDCSADFDWNGVLDNADISLFALAVVNAAQYVDVKQRPCQQGQLTCIAFNKAMPAAAKDVIIQGADKDGNTSGCPVNWSVRPILTYDAGGKPSTFGAQTASGSIPSGQSATVSIAGADEGVIVWCQDNSALQCKISYIPPK